VLKTIYRNEGGEIFHGPPGGRLKADTKSTFGIPSDTSDAVSAERLIGTRLKQSTVPIDGTSRNLRRQRRIGKSVKSERRGWDSKEAES